MSDTPGRPHEDGGNSGSSTSGSGNHILPSGLKYSHDVRGGKVVPSSRHDCHATYDMGQEGHIPEIAQRTNESRDAEQRSPLPPNMLFRVHTPNDSHSDHVGTESRMDFRDPKDSTKEIKVENRNMKPKSRELSPAGKSDKYDGRVDAGREDTDSERWGSEKKEPQKDKGKFNEKEKDSVKEELWSGSDKEAPHIEKELVEISEKSREQEKSTLELKKKDNDNWKNVGREVRNKKKERNAELEPERPEKRIRKQKKEIEDSMRIEGGNGQEREVSSCGSQQKKRMLRSRDNPRLGNYDSHFRSGANDSEGSKGKASVPCVIYKIGECMQEIMKLWKKYESLQADKACNGAQHAPTLEICIPAEHVTATNRQVRGGQLWGTNVYTVDSDLVAVLMHTGYYRPAASPPPSPTQELRATIRVLPPQDCYTSTLRNNIRSRAWGAAVGCSYCVERCCIVKKGGGTIVLEPCLTHSSTMEPTLAPVPAERPRTTRAAALNALRRKRFVHEVTCQFNLCFEPWKKYCISAVSDNGLEHPLFTSARLKKGEVLYVESRFHRYEICYTGEKVIKAAAASHARGSETGKSQTNNADGESTVNIFRWSRCKQPLPQIGMQSIGIPLPLEYVEVLEDNIEWDDIYWSETGVWIGGREYHLSRAQFISQD